MFLCDINQIQFHIRREITHLKRQDISKCCSRIRNDFVCHKRLDFKIFPNQELYYKTLKKQKTAALLLSGAFIFDFKFFLLLSRSQILNCYHLLKLGLNTEENYLNCCFFVFYRFVFSFYFFSIFVFLIITKCKKKKANKKTTTKKTKKETILEYIN